MAQKKEDNEEKKSDLLDVGKLPHHEIKQFYLDEDDIEKHCDPINWSNCDATFFDVRRGPDYVSGQKAPSKTALYSVFAMDAYSMDEKVNKISRFVDVEKHIADNKAPYHREKWPLPPIIIINVMIPDYAPELTTGKVNGEGYQIVFYCKISDEVRRTLDEFAAGKIDRLPSAIQLLANFVHSGPDSPLRQRFKIIGRIMNLKFSGFSFVTNRLVNQYNGKPFLARTSSTFYHEPSKFFAIDIDAHLFGYPARKGLTYIKHSMQNVIYDAAFVVEGHSNDELPEQVLCCARVSKIGIDQVVRFPANLVAQHYREIAQMQNLPPNWPSPDDHNNLQPPTLSHNHNSDPSNSANAHNNNNSAKSKNNRNNNSHNNNSHNNNTLNYHSHSDGDHNSNTPNPNNSNQNSTFSANPHNHNTIDPSSHSKSSPQKTKANPNHTLNHSTAQSSPQRAVSHDNDSQPKSQTDEEEQGTLSRLVGAFWG